MRLNGLRVVRRLVCGVGLLAANAAIAGPAARGEPPRAVTVVVLASEYRFAPNRLIFERGVAYRLHLENHGSETHEFTAPEFFAAVEVGNPELLNADRTEIVVQPGEMKDFDFVARRAGRYKLRCSDHDWAGMTGRIIVR